MYGLSAGADAEDMYARRMRLSGSTAAVMEFLRWLVEEEVAGGLETVGPLARRVGCCE